MHSDGAFSLDSLSVHLFIWLYNIDGSVHQRHRAQQDDYSTVITGREMAKKL